MSRGHRGIRGIEARRQRNYRRSLEHKNRLLTKALEDVNQDSGSSFPAPVDHQPLANNPEGVKIRGIAFHTLQQQRLEVTEVLQATQQQLQTITNTQNQSFSELRQQTEEQISQLRVWLHTLSFEEQQAERDLEASGLLFVEEESELDPDETLTSTNLRAFASAYSFALLIDWEASNRLPPQEYLALLHEAESYGHRLHTDCPPGSEGRDFRTWSANPSIHQRL